MFTTAARVAEVTGVVVTGNTLATANMMVEAYVGKPESEITNATDLDLLAKATTFQAVYINGQTDDILEQVAIKSTKLGEASLVMNVEMMAPFMSPWAVLTLKHLSWRGTRTVNTGRTFGSNVTMPVWERN
jgi:hypothetical protein